MRRDAAATTAAQAVPPYLFVASMKLRVETLWSGRTTGTIGRAMAGRHAGRQPRLAFSSNGLAPKKIAVCCLLNPDF